LRFALLTNRAGTGELPNLRCSHLKNHIMCTWHKTDYMYCTTMYATCTLCSYKLHQAASHYNSENCYKTLAKSI